MTFLRKVSENPVRLSKTPEDLSAILDPACAAAIWERQPLPGLQTWLDALDPRDLPKARVILQPKKVCEIVLGVCENCGTPSSAERDAFVQDVTALTNTFATIMSAQWLRLRLDVIETNACRKFHIDAVTARLICTYRGTGTQYGTSQNREDPENIHTVPTGSPIMLCGTLWPDSSKSGLLHRSPPIEGTGEVRLVLVLDPVDGPEEKSAE